ncbi:MAG: hypothetical protein CMG66_04265, partial [Candidatus Marinimicrobia bacterium]|nr:hypothetical protein [Candidatus Neomarinimicrobiota bacterium]
MLRLVSSLLLFNFILSNINPISAPGDDVDVTINSQFTLDATESFDEDGEVATYSWDYSDCTNQGFTLTAQESDAVITLLAPNQGDLTCRAELTVTDNDGYESEQWAAENLFISEYAEALSSQDTYVEIYNGTDSQVNLADYSIKITRDNGSEYELSLDNEGGDSINDGLLE